MVIGETQHKQNERSLGNVVVSYIATRTALLCKCRCKRGVIDYSDCVVGCLVERMTLVERTPGTAKQPEMACHFESD